MAEVRVAMIMYASMVIDIPRPTVLEKVRVPRQNHKNNLLQKVLFVPPTLLKPIVLHTRSERHPFGQAK
jgi:hypothetical protein